ncbi:ISL3 family transposase [uncultured Nocardioides sp.]|uniref:ISL3 family transposase n=1 Tax=uncultured Nocardioides sp. TaxID=198441 RepID=UPI002621E790|nr:ISL3 family transposase [uncultured Nocardioides sp.]
MQNATLWRALLGVEKTVVEDIEFDEDEELLVAHVRPRARARARGRCGRCERRAPAYDRGEGRRRWRALDLGTVRVVLEAEAPRVRCPEHGPTVAAVPWARHGTGHTYVFDEQVAWLATQCSKTAVTELMRIAWRTVGAIITRVWADVEALHDRFADLRRLGIDEISYKRGHRYLTVVVDHDTGRLVWAAPGRNKATLEGFFDALGPERSVQITHISADGADWISTVVAEKCPNAVRCADPFHVVRWATDALDEVRRQAWNESRGAVTQRRAGRASGHAKALKGARYALWKNPENLTSRQQAKLAWVAKTDPRLHRAYLLKEGLRLVFQLPHSEAKEALDIWIGWARRCRIPAFIDLQRRIVKHRAAILAAIEHGLSNGRIESVNTKIRLITRIAFGFRSPEALIALAMLNLGGHRPVLPGRK